MFVSRLTRCDVLSSGRFEFLNYCGDEEMDKPQGIIVFGPNGSGKTTLGRELARILNFKHMDIEDYYFEKSEIPYTIERSHEDCLNLMLADIEKYRSFIITALTGEFGDTIPMFYNLAVYMTAPKELRVKRVKQRAYKHHGERVCEGGDMYEDYLKFVNAVSSCSLSRIEQWMKTLSCPVIRIDGAEDWRVNAEIIAERFYNETL